MLVSGGAPAMPSSTEHSISTPSMAASTSTFGSYRLAVSIAACSPAMSTAFDVPMLEPPLAGFTNSGQPSSAIASSTRLRSGWAGSLPVPRAAPALSASPAPLPAPSASRPVTLTHDDVLADRQAAGLEDHLHVFLVHADRAGQHAGSHVTDAGHLQQALHRAVLAERSVQDRKHHVDLAEQVRDIPGR